MGDIFFSHECHERVRHSFSDGGWTRLRAIALAKERMKIFRLEPGKGFYLLIVNGFYS
jgi:hypothetical protein